MKILVSDKLGEIGIEKFQHAEGMEVDVKTGLSPEELKTIIKNYDALVIRSATKVTPEILEAASNLKVIGRAGIGLDNVDIPEATKRGVVVMNTPEGNVITTAEHAISMMLALTRNIPQGTSSLKQGRWDKKILQGREVFHKVLGVIGLGKIGSIVADRARGLKMQVIVYDPYVIPEQIEKAGFEAVSLEELYKRSDYITVHVPKLKSTIGLINKEAFEQMKDTAMLINCARGGIVNEEDLNEALRLGKITGAALDVFENEPPGPCALLENDRLICTPHLGASTREAQTNVAVAVADQIIDYLQNGTVKNAVNVPSVTGESLAVLGPYLTLADRMGCLHAQLADGPVEEILIEYTGEFTDLDLAPVATAFLKGMLSTMIKYDVNFVNARVITKDRGIKLTESISAESEAFINLMTVTVISTKGKNRVSGTIFGKKDERVVRINDFRLEMIPHGHSLLITNMDKPGAIGSVGVTLGKHKINIGGMQVGQTVDGEERNIILLQTDTQVPSEVVEEILNLPLVKTVTSLEL
ncbi:D-3-phosphoglycerate dehydrogenase [Candidatus Magnetomoraceae bacterium gMMP-15]